MLLQQLVVAIAVAMSVGYLLQRQWPERVRRLRSAFAVRLLRTQGNTAHALGRWIAPQPRAQSECGSCNGCGPESGGR